MTDVVVVGSYNHDHVWRTPQFPVPGETRLGAFFAGPGGKGFNQAVAAARQGVRTAFVGAMGHDAIGDGAGHTGEKGVAERSGVHQRTGPGWNRRRIARGARPAGDTHRGSKRGGAVQTSQRVMATAFSGA